jgi:hypothetical protein
MSASWPSVTNTCYTQKKSAALPVDGSEELKRTNEIKTAIPLLDAIDIEGKEIYRGCPPDPARHRRISWLKNVTLITTSPSKTTSPTLFEDIAILL